MSLKRALCGTGNYQAYITETNSLSKANSEKAVHKSNELGDSSRKGKWIVKLFEKKSQKLLLWAGL